jgi:hypothetical protein
MSFFFGPRRRGRSPNARGRKRGRFVYGLTSLHGD